MCVRARAHSDPSGKADDDEVLKQSKTLVLPNSTEFEGMKPLGEIWCVDSVTCAQCDWWCSCSVEFG
jgi:hypothetical protein